MCETLEMVKQKNDMVSYVINIMRGIDNRQQELQLNCHNYYYY